MDNLPLDELIVMEHERGFNQHSSDPIVHIGSNIEILPKAKYCRAADMLYDRFKTTTIVTSIEYMENPLESLRRENIIDRHNIYLEDPANNHKRFEDLIDMANKPSPIFSAKKPIFKDIVGYRVTKEDFKKLPKKEQLKLRSKLNRQNTRRENRENISIDMDLQTMDEMGEFSDKNKITVEYVQLPKPTFFDFNKKIMREYVWQHNTALIGVREAKQRRNNAITLAGPQ